MASLSWLDLAVCIATLASSALIGAYFAWKSEGGASEYLRGGKSMSILPVSLSLVASFISGITLLGLPAEVYVNGTQFLVSVFSAILMGLVVGIFLVPTFVELQLDSCYQYLELRFDRRVRRMSSLLYVINQLFFIPVVILVPALALSQVTGLNVHVSTLATSFVCIFYTTFGGLRAVVWTDALQTVLLVIASVTVLFLGVYQVGGFQNVISITSKAGKIQFFDLDPSPLRRNTFWTVLIGNLATYIAHCGLTQGFVQRYLAVPTLKDARWTVLWMTIGMASVMTISGFTGLVAYALFHECDPIATGRVSRPDQVVPLMLLDVAAHVPGLPGLFVAGVFSAALSSMSTGMNSVCGVIVEDLLADQLPKKFSKGVWLRLVAALTGIVSVSLVFVVEKLGGVLQTAISLNGVTFGVTVGLFVVGLFCPRVTSRAALIGSIVSVVLMSLLSGCSQFAAWQTRNSKPKAIFDPDNPCNVTILTSTPVTPVDQNEIFSILRFSYLYYTLLGAILVMVVSMGLSLFVPSTNVTLPPANLLHPLARRLLPSERTKRHEQIIDLASAQPLVKLNAKRHRNSSHL